MVVGSPLARLTAILARTPGIPDSTSLTMGGEVELEVTIGDLRMLAATLAKALASANHQRKQKQASNISRNRAVQGIEHWKARAEAAEAALTIAQAKLDAVAKVADTLELEAHTDREGICYAAQTTAANRIRKALEG